MGQHYQQIKIYLAYVDDILHDDPWTMEAATFILVIIISKYRTLCEDL
jgi:hypothetical protein